MSHHHRRVLIWIYDFMKVQKKSPPFLLNQHIAHAVFLLVFFFFVKAAKLLSLYHTHVLMCKNYFDLLCACVAHYPNDTKHCIIISGLRDA